jgi:hypothetical protein
VRAFVRGHPEDVGFFRRVAIPDELFFQTIVLKSSARGTGRERQPAIFRLLRCDRQQSPGPGHPDPPRLATSTALFARKFDTTADAGVLDRMDADLLALG